MNAADVDDATAGVDDEVRRPVQRRNIGPRTAPTGDNLAFASTLNAHHAVVVRVGDVNLFDKI